ncbi:TrkH family potassium uptake protein [Streptococcus cuniculipharyngis]|uniref:TrkH family potassium uptake protein n=1 Tax=Streptococcus cuniculipharyngis TaxID=1562651 RepID=A0A5C5S8N1_9STRE|nr:TrkH family potassium uptake protein [Streptococcus cuniculipharyngis]TWS96668.1 TrkH family potassium uptake protein [Streptococcus cuniculipharyngis]
MNRRMVGYLMAKLFFIEAGLLTVPLITALIYQEPLKNTSAILLTMGLLLLLGGLGLVLKPNNHRIYTKEGLIIVSLCWLLWSFFGGLPFFFSGQIPNLIDAFFETTSGFTSTGATILDTTKVLSPSLLLWRSFTQLIGGMGVLVFALAIMDNPQNNHLEVMRAEMAGPVFGKVVSKLKNTAQILYLIYLAMFIILALILWLAGLSFYDSLVTAMGVAGTGGFAGYENNIAYYNNSLITVIVSVGMLVFGVNFNLYYLILLGKVRSVFKNEELKLYGLITLIAVVAISININGLYPSLKDTLEKVFFQVSSVLTSTGFGHPDIQPWPLFSQTLLLLLMFCGGMAGSTAGGFKIMRVLTLLKLAKNQVLSTLYPNRVLTLNVNGTPLDNKTQQSILKYLVLYLMVLSGLILLLSLDNDNFLIVASASLSALNNVGPILGTNDNFNLFSPLSKIILSFVMIAGRLELYPLILFFLPKTWSKT